MAKTSVIARSEKTPKFSTRTVNRCFKLASEGMIPGIKKASW